MDKPTKEKVALDELRERIAEIIKDDKMFDDDLFLLQWLKSQNLKADRTETSIRESLKWRAENNVSTLVKQDISTSGISQDLSIIIDGVGKDGLPVVLLTVGGLNFREIIDKYGKEAIYSYWTQVYAKVEQIMIAYNKNRNKAENGDLTKNITWNSSEGVTVIVNIKNFSLMQAQSLAVCQVILNGAKIIMKYFPANVSCAYFINMNMFFSLLFKLLKPVLSSPSMRLELFDCDEKKWLPSLLQFVDEDQLTPEFGGRKIINYSD